jgi:hypothetical protein
MEKNSQVPHMCHTETAVHFLLLQSGLTPVGCFVRQTLSTKWLTKQDHDYQRDIDPLPRFRRDRSDNASIPLGQIA